MLLQTARVVVADGAGGNGVVLVWDQAGFISG
jgi:hypothetical protein